MATSPAQVVQEIYAAFGRRDVTAVFARLSADVELVQSTELPWGGCYRGLDGARQFMTKLTTHLDSAVTLERMIAAGDHMVAIGWTEGRVRTTSTPFRVPIAHVWQVNDGKVSRVQFFIDHAPMRTALSASTP
jgi:ketosteroid isomerase-like protein